MGEESSIGLMGVHSLENTLKTLNPAKGVTNGQTVNLMMENGIMVSKTEWVYSLIRNK